MAGARMSTYPETIQAAVRDELVSAVGVPAACAFLVSEPRRPAPAPPSLNYVTVALPTYSRHPDSTPFEDPPREIDWCDGDLSVSLWVQCQLDQDGRSDVITADRLNGIAGFLREATAALNDFDPLDPNGDYVLKCPLTFLDSRREEPDVREWRGWLRNELRFACQFVWNLTSGTDGPPGMLWPSAAAMLWPSRASMEWPR